MKNEKGTLLKICFMLDSMGIVIEPTGEPGGSLVPFLFKNRANN